ncbi:beta-ketoacyl synthase N-terminal-like domain-containing protein [Burkholderia gladioli]|uniref:beta-ketoacyl synthase N-terminal-like domain-containing protein n=1 Tax=Burkholderia gladioli TaxID=28095 RepID=UPI0038B3025E
MALASDSQTCRPVWIAHADALTCLGYGPELHAALLAGRSGLTPAAEAFPNVERLAGAGMVGRLKTVEGEVRVPGILASGLRCLAPDTLLEADLMVGACSLGDLAGPDAGQPRMAFERALRDWSAGKRLPSIQFVSSACSSGTDALGLGAMSIAAGVADVVAVIAFDSLPAGKLVQHVALGTQSRDRARPFDVGRSGTSFGEAVALVLLASEQGLRRLGLSELVRVAGFGMSGDAHDVVAPDPDGRHAARAIQVALRGANSGAVGYVNTHGSGTPLNDRAEVGALRCAIGPAALGKMHIGGTKGALGHTLGATGLVEAVVAARALSDGRYPPTAGLEQPDPNLDITPAMRPGMRSAHQRYALSVTFGFGGVNSAVLLEEARHA